MKNRGKIQKSIFQAARNDQQVRIRRLMYVPREVAFEDLNPDLKLKNLVSYEIKNRQRQSFFSVNVKSTGKNRSSSSIGSPLVNDVLYSKKEFNTSASFVLSEGEYYQLYELVGRGGFGKAVLAQKTSDATWHVVKKQFLDRSGIEAVESEHKNLAEIVHSPDSPRMPHSPKTPLKMRNSPSKKRDQYIILMSAAEGVSLDSIINLEGDLGEDGEYLTFPIIHPLARLQAAIEIPIAGKKFLTSQKMLHCDHKPGNIFIRLFDQEITLIDLGFAGKVDSNGHLHTKKPRGTSIYLAPEIRCEVAKYINGEDANFDFNEKTDVYALGVTLAQLFGLLDYSRIPKPFDYESNDTFIASEKSDYFLKNASLPHEILKKVLNLINAMTISPPALRMDFDQAVTELNRIKQQYCEDYPYHAVIKVGVLDVNEYLTIGQEAQEKLIHDLKESYTELYLIDTGDTHRGDYCYIGIKKNLEEKTNLMIAEDVVIGRKKSEILEVIQGVLKHSKLPSRLGDNEEDLSVEDMVRSGFGMRRPPSNF